MNNKVAYWFIVAGFQNRRFALKFDGFRNRLYYLFPVDE